MTATQQTYSSGPSNTSRSAPSGPKVSYQVYLLDGHPIEVTVSRKAKGEELLQEVFRSMNPPLEERDYFSLTFDVMDEKEPIAWLDRSKSVEKQMKKANNPAFAMNVKFYPPDPTTLMEYTRYLFYLQIRDDVAKGKLPCSLSTLALLGSFVCQADQADYTPDLDLNSIHDLPLFSPHVSQAEATVLLERILQLYRTHRGMTTAEAEQNYLEVAKKLTLYGVTTKPCSDSQGVRLYLGVSASGILVFREQLRLNRFAWAKIIKISYKKTDFAITLLRNDYDGIDSVIMFKMDSQKEAKNFWKICIEHHQFFRLFSANPKPRKAFFGPSHPTLMGQTEYQIKKSATLSRGDTFARNTLSGRRTQTLPASVHSQGGIRAPPSPQSGEYEPRRHEQIQSRMNNGVMSNGGSADDPNTHHYSSVGPNARMNDDYPINNSSPVGHPDNTAQRGDYTLENSPYRDVQQVSLVQHATVTTTVHTSIRMPPSQPPPRLNPSTESDEDPEPKSPSSPTNANNESGASYHLNAVNGDPNVQPGSPQSGAGEPTNLGGIESDNDDELIASVTPASPDAELHGDQVRTASIVYS